MDKCNICGANLALVGRIHNCRPQAKATPTPLVANAAPVVVNKVANSRHGQYADKEKRRAYMREYMRKKRTSKALLKTQLTVAQNRS